ncbi:spore cortex biosynthesis protein YabQ [Clostridium botulinum]|uniref:Spore cortex biosynthesis protein YabQ n=1 Tax=Clostridium botulinum TaxID=1491 RepID=A0A6B4JPA1_CLOBO|nr:spore cortex biosynthesis protein YabQ [Clostridium botulinum]EES49149.1 spore cortex biosynthesis protein YabQ [Clostridium botulinum E1 str. 'BoNT E Beluga']MBY6762287.1 spore cortex biosynthesis protein YabQ [Clostridium botulinum]MBY6921130.1 spore cortex biosynthesis protein YabQ [Clostridium botulinum]MCR1132013.1 spore cortex biosynthesis protein YabQ [Clostridium botulinum]NFH69311.1 spore cortex biosynthesis protein YabQ [Clostridium botulinum]
MPLTLTMQFNLLMYSVIAGIITGFLFDIYRGIRGLNSIKIITVIEDILFWILTALIIFTFLLYTNYAFLTPYVYIFIIISLLIYLKVISSYFYSLEQLIIRKVNTFLRIIFKNLIYPIKIVFYKVIDKSK